MTIKDIDRRILRAIAQEQRDKEPFHDDIEGVSYKDIRSEFSNEDFGGVNPTMGLPPRIGGLADEYVSRVYRAANNPNRYRLTDRGEDVATGR